jgi:hypothetical protein
MTRYVFKAIDFIVSIVFLALCIKAFCTHFYQDIERQLHRWVARMPNLPFNRNVVLALTRATYTLPQMFLNRPGASAA